MKTPSFLYGTAWKEEETERCVVDALHAGFRGIDTANQRRHYFEAGVGTALAKVYSEGLVTRKDLFLQTKFTYLRGQDQRLPYDPAARASEQVKQSFASSLEHLSTDYIDSYVLHGPSSSYGLTPDDWAVWGTMEELHQAGKTKLLGVSNVNLGQLRELYAKAQVKPSFVQNRCYARLGWDKDVRTFCKDNKITYQGFSLLTANQEIFQNPRFNEVVQRVGCTPAQTVFSFSRQIGMLPITGTTDPVHMKEDLESLHVELSPNDIQVIESIALG